MAGLSAVEHCWATGALCTWVTLTILCADDAGAGSSRILEPLALVLTSGTLPSLSWPALTITLSLMAEG